MFPPIREKARFANSCHFGSKRRMFAVVCCESAWLMAFHRLHPMKSHVYNKIELGFGLQSISQTWMESLDACILCDLSLDDLVWKELKYTLMRHLCDSKWGSMNSLCSVNWDIRKKKKTLQPQVSFSVHCVKSKNYEIPFIPQADMNNEVTISQHKIPHFWRLSLDRSRPSNRPKEALSRTRIEITPLLMARRKHVTWVKRTQTKQKKGSNRGTTITRCGETSWHVSYSLAPLTWTVRSSCSVVSDSFSGTGGVSDLFSLTRETSQVTSVDSIPMSPLFKTSRTLSTRSSASHVYSQCTCCIIVLRLRSSSANSRRNRQQTTTTSACRITGLNEIDVSVCATVCCHDGVQSHQMFKLDTHLVPKLALSLSVCIVATVTEPRRPRGPACGWQGDWRKAAKEAKAATRKRMAAFSQKHAGAKLCVPRFTCTGKQLDRLQRSLTWYAREGRRRPVQSDFPSRSQKRPSPGQRCAQCCIPPLAVRNDHRSLLALVRTPQLTLPTFTGASRDTTCAHAKWCRGTPPGEHRNLWSARGLQTLATLSNRLAQNQHAAQKQKLVRLIHPRQSPRECRRHSTDHASRDKQAQPQLFLNWMRSHLASNPPAAEATNHVIPNEKGCVVCCKGCCVCCIEKACDFVLVWGWPADTVGHEWKQSAANS